MLAMKEYCMMSLFPSGCVRHVGFFTMLGTLLAYPAWAAPSTSASATAPADTPVHILHLPEKDLVPDATVDAKGVLHVVYGNDHNAWYLRSTDNGRTFSTPVQINSEGSVETEMGERGPKLAIDNKDTIHVVWTDKWKPGVKTAVRYARSTDGGRTFEPRRTLSSMSGIDGVTLAADAKGNVIAFWHVMEGPKPETPAATWLFLARSRNSGRTFETNEPLQVDNLSPLACSMCMMRPRVGPDGQVYLAFRSAVDNIRDLYVLKSPVEKNAFSAIRVNTDNWTLPSCPMCGPELNLTPGAALLCAFMSEHKVYWSISTAKRDKFLLHVATPANEKDEIYPCAVANRAGQVLFLWQVGPMSTSGTATVKWALYAADGRLTGWQGTIGQSYSGTKPTAFLGTDDGFYILTSAR
jgi:hypothetical protein